MVQCNWLTVALTVIVLSTGSGCINGSGQLKEQQALNKRLNTIEQQQAALTRQNTNSQQKLIADTNIRLDNLEREIKLLSEAVEDSVARPEDLPATNKFEYEAIISRLEERLLKLEQSATSSSGIQSPPPATTNPPAAIPTPSPGAREKALYDDALAAFKRGNTKTAKDKFKKFITSFPSSSYKVNAQFWIGECFYKNKDYAEAIIKYDEIIASHSQHPKAPSALLKQGFAFIQLGDATDGKLILEKVIANYPNSDQAEIARRKLATIK